MLDFILGGMTAVCREWAGWTALADLFRPRRVSPGWLDGYDFAADLPARLRTAETPAP